MLNHLVVTKLYARLGNMYNPKMTFNMSSVAMCSKTITILIFSSKFGFINDVKVSCVMTSGLLMNNMIILYIIVLYHIIL